MGIMTRPKILVVDDEKQNVELLEALLCNDYDIKIAHDGIEAMLIVETDLPDLILLDVMMPKMNGYEVCNKIKQDPRTMGIPIIMISALQDKNDKVQALEFYADDFLNKPIDIHELNAKVKSLLRMKQYHDALAGDVRFLYEI